LAQARQSCPARQHISVKENPLLTHLAYPGPSARRRTGWLEACATARSLGRATLLLACLLLPLRAGAVEALPDLDGVRTVVFERGNGERQAIATIRFEPLANGRYRFLLRESATLKEQFLAMRPFKCVEGVLRTLCLFPFGSEAEVGPGELWPLEYQLMFLHKAPSAVAIDSRNGIYFRLSAAGRGFAAQPHDVDMEPIIVPDGTRNPRRPIVYGDLLPMDRPPAWLPRLTIE
jgi:hypothetical protein